MKDLVRAAMEEGAFGLSSGLFYAPGSFAKTDEVIELAKVAPSSAASTRVTSATKATTRRRSRLGRGSDSHR